MVVSSKCSESFYDCLGGKHRSSYVDVTFTLPGKDPETWRLVTGTALMRDQKSVADLCKLAEDSNGISFSLDFQGVALPFDPVHCQGRKYRDSFDPVKAKEVLGAKYFSWLSTTAYSLPLFPKESVMYSRKVATEFLKESTVVGVVDYVRKYPSILAIGPKAFMENHAYGNLGVLDSVVTEMARRVDGASKDFKKSLDQFMEYYTYAFTSEHGRPNAEAVLALAVKLGFVHLVDPASVAAAKEKNRRDILKLLDIPMEEIQKKRLHRAHSLLEKYTYAVVAAGEKGMSIDDVDVIVKEMLTADGRTAGTGQWATEDRIRVEAEDNFRRLVDRGKLMVNDARKNIIDTQTTPEHFDDYAMCRNLQTTHDDERVSVKDMMYDDLYIVHETAYTVEQDEDGNYVLYPHGDKTGSNRETIHFGVNHKVLGHMERSGSKAKFAVVANMKKLVEMNPGCVDAIHEVDTILTPPTGRGLKLPQDCVIVKYTPAEVTAESRNDAVERALQQAGSRFSFCGKGSTDCVAVDGVSESLKTIAVEQGVLYAHATNHPMYHHELRTSAACSQNEGPVVIASTATKDPDGLIGCRVSAAMVARLSPNGRARLFTQDAWIRSSKPPLPAYVHTDPKEELVEMWRQFVELGNNIERPELCKQLMASDSQNLDTPPDSSFATQYLFKETLLQTRGSRIAPEGINAQASCEQRAAVVRDTLVDRHGLVRCATETRIQPKYSASNSERAGLPTYREIVTDNGTSRTPLAVFTLVGVTASGEVISYTSRDSTVSTPSLSGLFNADEDMNITRHPSVVDALRGTGIKSEGHEALVPTMGALLEVIKQNSEAQQADMHPQQRLEVTENLLQHVELYDTMVLSGGDSSYMREVRGSLLASMPESIARHLAID